MNIYAIHGFLGGPSDWDFLAGQLPSNYSIHAIDVYGSKYAKPQKGLWSWARSFNAGIRTSPNILLGYSMGGRLALHSLLCNPQLWAGAIIVSSHPGNLPETERNSRKRQDEDWAKRFSQEEWKSIMEAWNAQPVFKGSRIPIRDEYQLSRTLLAESLVGWSVALQDNLLPSLETLDMPTLWIAGSRDEKYARLSKQLSLRHGLSKIWIAEGAGHRVPWDDQIGFCQSINNFLTSIQEW